MEKEYYGIKEMAKKLGYEPITIYRHVWFGDLRAFKIGKEYRIAHAEFDRFMAACEYRSPYNA